MQTLINNDRAYDALDVVQEIADGHGVPVQHIALAWLLANPVITAPIVGARTLAHLEGALGATELSLTDEELEQLNAVSEGF